MLNAKAQMPNKIQMTKFMVSSLEASAIPMRGIALNIGNEQADPPEARSLRGMMKPFH